MPAGQKLNRLSGDGEVTTLSELYNLAKEICKISKQFKTSSKREKNLASKKSLTDKQLAKWDEYGAQKELLEQRLQELIEIFKITMDQTESSIASLGLK